MTTLRNMKFRIKDEQQSEELQRVLFELGYSWVDGNGNPNHKSRPYLYTYSSRDLYYTGSGERYFHDHNNEETDTAAFIAQHSKNAPTKKEENDMGNVKKAHKHKDAIVAYAHGAEIDVRAPFGVWAPTGKPSFEDHLEYRVRPTRTFPKSTLRRQDLLKIVQDTPGDFMDSYVAMVDAAVERYILDQEAKQKGLE